jgi:hypothetical protein
MFAAFEQFMDGERLYQYQDIEAESGNLRAWGMRTNDRVLLWIDNRLHTWKRVADGEPVPTASGTISIAGLEGDWLVQWWDTTSGTVTGQDALHADGALDLVITDLTSDVAVKVFRPAVYHFLYLPLALKDRIK